MTSFNPSQLPPNSIPKEYQSTTVSHYGQDPSISSVSTAASEGFSSVSQNRDRDSKRESLEGRVSVDGNEAAKPRDLLNQERSSLSEKLSELKEINQQIKNEKKELSKNDPFNQAVDPFNGGTKIKNSEKLDQLIKDKGFKEHEAKMLTFEIGKLEKKVLESGGKVSEYESDRGQLSDLKETLSELKSRAGSALESGSKAAVKAREGLTEKLNPQLERMDNGFATAKLTTKKLGASFFKEISQRTSSAAGAARELASTGITSVKNKFKSAPAPLEEKGVKDRGELEKGKNIMSVGGNTALIGGLKFELDFRPPGDRFLSHNSTIAGDKERLRDLTQNMTNTLSNLGANFTTPNSFKIHEAAPSIKLPKLDLRSLDPNQDYVVAEQGNKQITFTGAEIQEMAKSAKIWTAGNREGTFENPGLEKGVSEKSVVAMMETMTFGKVPRAMINIDNKLMEKSETDHFVCNASAPDLTNEKIKAEFSTTVDGVTQYDMGKISSYINRVVKDFVDASEQEGVSAINVPAMGLGAFAGNLNAAQKKEYAQAIVDAVANNISEESSIKQVVFSGREFLEVRATKLNEEGNAIYLDGVKQQVTEAVNLNLNAFTDKDVGVIVTNNDLSNIELAEGAQNLTSATLMAGDQNKLGGYHTWMGATALHDDPAANLTGNIALDEAHQLRTPLFGIIHTPTMNAYLGEKLGIDESIYK